MKRRHKIRKRKAQRGEGGAVADGDPTMGPPPAQRRRVDADGFAIADLPIDPALTGADGSDAEIDPSLTSAVNTALSELEALHTPSKSQSTAMTSTGDPSTLDSSLAVAVFEQTAEPSANSKGATAPKRRRRKPKIIKKPNQHTAAELGSEGVLESEMADILSHFDPTSASTRPAVANSTDNQGPANRPTFTRREIPLTEDKRMFSL